MKAIYEYAVPVSDDFVVSIPEGAVFLDVQLKENNGGKMWWLIDSTATERERRFCVCPTGYPISDAVDLTYLGTFQTGKWCWHLFEKASSQNSKAK